MQSYILCGWFSPRNALGIVCPWKSSSPLFPASPVLDFSLRLSPPLPWCLLHPPDLQGDDEGGFSTIDSLGRYSPSNWHHNEIDIEQFNIRGEQDFSFPSIPGNESLWFLFPNYGNGFFYSIPVPEFQECFFNSLPVDEFWDWFFF